MKKPNEDFNLIEFLLAVFTLSMYFVCWQVSYYWVNEDMNLEMSYDYFVMAWTLSGGERPTWIWMVSIILYVGVVFLGYILYLIFRKNIIMKKKYNELTRNDFINMNNWEFNFVDDYVIPREDIDNLKTDELIYSKVDYSLNDGTNLIGYCYLYEVSGFQCFYGSKNISLGRWDLIDNEEISEIVKNLDRKPEDIFPIAYKCSTELFGRINMGNINSE